MKRLDRVSAKVLEALDYVPKDESGAPIVPIDLNLILKEFGLKAYNTKFNKPGVSGALDRDKKQIYVNEDDIYSRKVFTVAHELGHYILHADLPYDILYRDKSGQSRDDVEKEADEFAGELLMPESTIRVYWTVAESVQQLAEIFSVSYTAMECRLRKLGLI